MAGDWIKLEHATVDKPEVWRMATLLKITPEEVLGHLIRVWCWADQQCTNVDNGVDTTVDVSVDAIDAVARLKGFANALLDVQWMVYENGRVTFPNLQGYISETAKFRALRNRRQSRYRVLKSNAQRREDVKPPLPPARNKRASKPKPNGKGNGNGHGKRAPLSDSGIQALGVKLGVTARPGESMEAYRQRVIAENEKTGR